MNFSPNPIYILLFAITLCVTQTAIAENCYQASPNLLERNQAYYDLDTVDNFSEIDQTTLDALLNKMLGKWEGTMTTMVCKGSDSAPQQNIKTATIEMRATRHSNRQVSLIAKKHDLVDGIRKNEHFYLLPRSNVYHLNLKEDATLTFSEKYRIQNVGHSSRLTEVIYDIQFDQKQLSINRTYFTNGVLTGAEAWVLESN
jgi:hypothetical protein